MLKLLITKPNHKCHFLKVFMKNPTKIGIFLIAGLFAIGVHSEPLNFDIGYSKLRYKEAKYPTDDVGHVKIAFSRNNFEALASVNVKSSKGTLSGSAYELKVPYILGLYYKPEISLGSGVNLFARVGLANSNVKVNIPVSGIETNSSSSGLSYGFGMSMLSSRTSKITFDYTSYHSQVNGFSITHTFLLP